VREMSMTDRDIARLARNAARDVLAGYRLSPMEREQEAEMLAATLEDVIGQCVENLAHRKVGA
jgi:hypothetical protein